MEEEVIQWWKMIYKWTRGEKRFAKSSRVLG